MRLLIGLRLSGGVIVLAMLVSPASGAAITFNTALPLSRNEAVYRQQFAITRASDNLAASSRDLTIVEVASVVGYGLTRRTAVFGVLPVIHIDREFGSAEFEATDFGDARLFARHEVLRVDRPGGTLRIAPFVGASLPTGDEDTTGDGSLDVFGGLIGTLATADWVFDAQLQYTANREANGFERGDEASFDASLQYRMLPRRLGPDAGGFLFGVVEFRVVELDEDRVSGVVDPNSGGRQIFVAPGLQYAAKRWIAEAAVRIPVVNDLNGDALEPDYAVVTSLRFNF